jgi:hypothetical protein
MNNIIEATILNGKIKGKDVRYIVRVQTLQFPVRLAFATKHKDTATFVWTKFGKSMFLTWTTVCGLLTRWKIF